MHVSQFELFCCIASHLNIYNNDAIKLHMCVGHHYGSATANCHKIFIEVNIELARWSEVDWGGRESIDDFDGKEFIPCDFL